ncbi:hypothetical protein B0T26DRAFT_163761 [Lasiosphaeria miniovina]|uniref:Uncharacterized protein n=1 Tax=Lasiosphaeria miniovina TaxID=1954250 RepID=A0AA40B5U6_9PEZI|nr:uncharacterized protein B0T26DRAFT_163761 [Lasiosphaeria miniovina]KAK0728217.1 hypothetical protein B0T26DRAFT_163761 [Lasiosphaeria miniovina]
MFGTLRNLALGVHAQFPPVQRCLYDFGGKHILTCSALTGRIVEPLCVDIVLDGGDEGNLARELILLLLGAAAYPCSTIRHRGTASLVEVHCLDGHGSRLDLVWGVFFQKKTSAASLSSPGIPKCLGLRSADQISATWPSVGSRAKDEQSSYCCCRLHAACGTPMRDWVAIWFDSTRHASRTPRQRVSSFASLHGVTGYHSRPYIHAYSIRHKAA